MEKDFNEFAEIVKSRKVERAWDDAEDSFKKKHNYVATSTMPESYEERRLMFILAQYHKWLTDS